MTDPKMETFLRIAAMTLDLGPNPEEQLGLAPDKELLALFLAPPVRSGIPQQLQFALSTDQDHLNWFGEQVLDAVKIGESAYGYTVGTESGNIKYYTVATDGSLVISDEDPEKK